MHRAALWRRIQEPAVASSSDRIGSGKSLETQGTNRSRTLDQRTGRYRLSENHGPHLVGALTDTTDIVLTLKTRHTRHVTGRTEQEPGERSPVD
jgi:hypothetical protein